METHLQESLDTSCMHQNVLESLLKMDKVCKESYYFMLSKSCMQDHMKQNGVRFYRIMQICFHGLSIIL